ncbi:MAG: VWA domain-containing protein [Deltaproteobacteria bacterium]|nr:VWA domain-containing protein [Deltaproteobacteria bacterium]
MNFAQPLWLFCGLAVCAALLLLIRFLQQRRQTTLAKFAALKLLTRLTRNISGPRRRLKNILVISAVFCCFVALARPQYGFKWVEVKRKGIDILFALDTSKSMLAEDIKPNRLERAHFAILDFVRQLDGDRVGLMPFAGSAFLMCPLTLDYNAFEHSLAAVDSNIIPLPGTDIAAVISKAAATLSNDANHKIVVLITDGENLQGDALKAAKEGAEKGLVIYTVGVGSREGELIPLPGGGFVKDSQDKFVTSKLDEQTLRTIAEKTGGLYVPLGSSGEGLETIYQQKLKLIPKDELAERRHKVPLEQFAYPLALALILLACDFLISERKSKRSLSLPSVKSISRRIRRNGGTVVLAVFIIFGLQGQARSSEGETAYSKGDYIGASEYYNRQLSLSPDDPQLQYNSGTAAYKNNMLDDAIAAFSKALKSNSVDLQKKAYYNRGNSYYRKGREMVQTDPQTTVKLWKQALDSLQSVQKLDPDDKNAEYNHELIKKELEKLQKQQEQQKQEDKKQNDKQNKDKDKDGKGKQGQNKNDNGQDKNRSRPDDKKQQQDAKTGEKSPQQQQSGAEKDKEQTNKNGKTAQPLNDDKKQMGGKEKQQAMDTRRQQQGKMTREEAERLLNGLKSEEGELNFVPSAQNKESNNGERNW